MDYFKRSWYLERPRENCNSIKAFFNYFQEMFVTKYLSPNNLKERYLQDVELTNKYYKKEMFDPPELSNVSCKTWQFLAI